MSNTSNVSARAATVRPIVFILGPTAGGKTELAIALANQLPEGGGEIISADSMQVYRGMNIGTAKPTLEEQARAVHHLIDIADPGEPFTVDDWRDLAEEKIDDIRNRGHWPIVVGGTNLYVRVLLEGMFKGPPADEEFRAEMNELETAELHRRLGEVDPEAAERIHPNDRKRLTRALEVFKVTGEPISTWQRQWDDAGTSADSARPDSILIGLDWPTDEINKRINARVKSMMAAGFLDEVRRLHEARRLGPQAREALGYKQLLAHLEGECSLDDAVERIKIETRRFARKQRTWLRRFRIHPRSCWLDASQNSPQALVKQSLTFCKRFARIDLT